MFKLTIKSPERRCGVFVVSIEYISLRTILLMDCK